MKDSIFSGRLLQKNHQVTMLQAYVYFDLPLESQVAFKRCNKQLNC